MSTTKKKLKIRNIKIFSFYVKLNIRETFKNFCKRAQTETCNVM